MIKGIGIDIIELSRIQKSVQNNPRFVHRILAEEEIKHYENLSTDRRKVEFLAGRFAAKEAFAKANGTGIGELSFRDIQVLSNENGNHNFLLMVMIQSIFLFQLAIVNIMSSPKLLLRKQGNDNAWTLF